MFNTVLVFTGVGGELPCSPQQVQSLLPTVMNLM